MTVTLYGKQDCRVCMAAKQLVQECQLPVEIVDIDEDLDAWADLMEMNISQIPALVFNDYGEYQVFCGEAAVERLKQMIGEQ